MRTNIVIQGDNTDLKHHHGDIIDKDSGEVLNEG